MNADIMSVLQFLYKLRNSEVESSYTEANGIVVTWNPPWATTNENYNHSIYKANFGLSKKAFRRLLKSMLKAELVSGCLCGCRGDIEITQKGINALFAKE